MLDRGVGDLGVRNAVEPESAHRFPQVAPPSQIPVRVDRLDPEGIHASAFEVTTRAQVVEFELHALLHRVADEGQRRRDTLAIVEAFDSNLGGLPRRSARQFAHEARDRRAIGILGQGRKILQTGDQRRGLPCRESRRIVDRDAVGEHDLVVIFEGIPVDVEQVVVLVGRRVTGKAAHRNEVDGIPNLVGRNLEVRRGFVDRDSVVVDEVRHERKQKKPSRA